MVDTTTKTYYCEVLQAEDTKAMEETAQIISDVFTGCYVGERYIDEPMITSLGVSNENFKNFNMNFLRHTVSQGLTVIAKDVVTGSVIGATMNEDFNPYEEIPNLEGEDAPYLKLYEFLVDLDAMFLNRIKEVHGEDAKMGEYVHLFLVGVKSEHGKAAILTELIEMAEQVAKDKGYRGLFAEATNYKSQRVLRDMCGYTLPKYRGKPVSLGYSGYETFSHIPEEISMDCQILYKPTESKYTL